jgi:hypothetical protein
MPEFKIPYSIFRIQHSEKTEVIKILDSAVRACSGNGP